MDGSFIKAGSGSIENERAAVYLKHEWHNEDQLAYWSTCYWVESDIKSVALPNASVEKLDCKNLNGRYVSVKNLMEEPRTDWFWR